MLNRTVAPPVNSVADITLPPIITTQLANGARLHVLEGGTQPIVRLELVFNAGKWYEPKAGVSHLTAKMLTEGTQSFTARQIADTVAMYGASLECHNGFDRTTITLYCLSKFFTKLLPLVKEVALAPSFPDHEFQLLVQRTIQNIRIEQKRTSYVATDTFSQQIYGKGHPYCTGVEEDNLRALTVADLQQFHTDFFNLGDCEIFLAGQVSSVIAETQSAFENEPGTKSTGKTHPILIKKDTLEPVIINMPESLQASIRVGLISPLRKHPDYFPFLILNEVLGGYFGSRLMKNIREDKGYTYGIYSTISAKERSSLFYIATDVNYLSAQDTLKEISLEIQKLKVERVGKEELETVQNYMTGKFLNSITSTFEQADKHKNIILQNLPSDYYSQYLKAIQDINAQKLQETAVTYFKDENLLCVVAGKKA